MSLQPEQQKSLARVGMEGVASAYVDRFEMLANIYDRTGGEDDKKFARIIRSQLEASKKQTAALFEILDE